MILVTGATGFVGQALIAELTRRQIAFRPLSRGPLQGYETIGMIDGDTDWTQSLSGIDTIIHLATRVHVMNDTAGDPLTAFRAMNVDATLNLARQAAAAGVERFVFLSSIKVNGEATEPGAPFTAGDEPHPEDPYGVSKHEAEQALLALGKATGLEIVIIRPPLVYGPGVRANFLSLLRWARRPVPWPFGSVANRRSLVFVGNLVDFIILAAHHPAAANRIFLVSDGKDLSIGELVKKLSRSMRRTATLVRVPPVLLETAAAFLGRKAAAQRLLGSLQVDISDTKDITGWSPPHSIDEGLQATVDAFLKER